MARLNIYIPDEVKELAEKWRGELNLSQICTETLKRELEALEFHRNLGDLLAPLKKASELEKSLARSYGLSECYLVNNENSNANIRETLGAFGAKYLNYYLSDDSQLAIGGGRQIWCVVKNLTSRQTSLSANALGIGQNDPRVLHAHPNTIVTILWLLFSPRGTAKLIQKSSDPVWNVDPVVSNHVRYFVVGSCGALHADGPLAGLMGESATKSLLNKGAVGDFLYNFLDRKGKILELPQFDYRTILDSARLLDLSKRRDARVILIAGGNEKREIVRLVLKNQICNVLITDTQTGDWLAKR